jgi:hypothetical protein
MKKCSKCNIEKDISEFKKHNGYKSGIGNSCKECERERGRLWRKKNPNYFKEYKKDNEEYYIKRKEYTSSERGKAMKRKWCNEYNRKNPHTVAWKSLIGNTLKRLGGEKSGHTIDVLGYSADELKEHIENLFTEGMSWDNWGEWHIDHIKPVSVFDPETDVSIVNALENLQPLWAIENLRKLNQRQCI